MRFVIVTGMSGAGRSSAMRILEDDGYFCVDNLPVSLLPTFMELTKNSSKQIEKVVRKSCSTSKSWWITTRRKMRMP